MKFYEIQDPYYALIYAKDEKTATQIYNETVCDIDEGITVYKISGFKAICKYIKTCIYEKTTINDAIKYFSNIKNTVVLLDRTLI